VRAAYENSGEWKKEQRAAGTTEGEQRVLDLLAAGAELSSGELYAKYRKSGGAESERQVRNYLEALELRKLVVVRDGQATGGRGKTRLIKLA
jgi:repressor of nif and glnA expression